MIDLADLSHEWWFSATCAVRIGWSEKRNATTMWDRCGSRKDAYG
jgi:hypothetical protein